MIRLNQNFAVAMEFTTFKKKESVTDDALINAVLQLESTFLKHQKGILFHCLVRNSDNAYANVLFVDNKNALKELEQNVYDNEAAKTFFDMIAEGSSSINFHDILKTKFTIPTSFSCVECGTFTLNNTFTSEDLIATSTVIEQKYLSKFENTKAHFIGQVDDSTYSEITFGETLGQTKEICSGYTTNTDCLPLLEMANTTSMKLDFWYLIA